MILTVPTYWKHSPKTHRTPPEPPKSPYPGKYPRSIKDRLQRNKVAINAPKNDGVQRMVDREAKRAEGKGIGYDRWAAVHNCCSYPHGNSTNEANTKSLRLNCTDDFLKFLVNYLFCNEAFCLAGFFISSHCNKKGNNILLGFF